MDKKQEIIDNTEDINAMPNVALDLMALINEPRTTITDLARVIKLDEALAAYILKNCNSPFYGIKNEVTSIPQALTLLGFSVLRTILMTYFNKNLYSISGKSEINNKLWIHSIGVASFSQAIARHLKLNEEEAYLAGLLHDIGKLIIYINDNTGYEKVLKTIENSETESYIVEENTLGYDHTQIGTLIMKKWKFSRTLIDVAQHHHSVTHYNDPNKYIAVVAFADLLAHQEIDEERIDLTFFSYKYHLNEMTLEKIIDTGIMLKETYLKF